MFMIIKDIITIMFSSTSTDKLLYYKVFYDMKMAIEHNGQNKKMWNQQ